MSNVIEMPIRGQPLTDLKCHICGGPISVGEPVNMWMDQAEGTVITHRFKTTCGLAHEVEI